MSSLLSSSIICHVYLPYSLIMTTRSCQKTLDFLIGNFHLKIIIIIISTLNQCLSHMVIVGSGIKLHKQIIQSEQDLIKNPKALERGGPAGYYQALKPMSSTSGYRKTSPASDQSGTSIKISSTATFFFCFQG